MINIEKQIAYWKMGAQEDWAVVQELLDHGHTRHGLFFLHLALEKILKAHVCRQTRDLAPRLHNLVKLADLAQLELSQEELDLLLDINDFNVESQYPEQVPPSVTLAEARSYHDHTGKVFAWLTNAL